MLTFSGDEKEIILSQEKIYRTHFARGRIRELASQINEEVLNAQDSSFSKLFFKIHDYFDY